MDQTSCSNLVLICRWQEFKDCERDKEGKGGGSDENRVHGMMVQVVLAAELYKGVAGGSFKITLARPALSFAQDLLHEICSGVVFVCATLIFFHHSYATKCICYGL